MKSSYRSVTLIVLSLAALWTLPETRAGPTLGNLVPRNAEANAMVVSPQGDVAVGSFYALDPTVIPWDLNKPIYKYVGVTLIVSNFGTSDLSQIVGITIPSAAPTLLPFKVILIIQGLQRNAPAIASDIESVFGLRPGSFTTLASNPLSLPVSVFGANLTSNPYSSFVSKFVEKTSAKPAVIGKYTASLLETSTSGIVFNSVESVVYPLNQLVTQTSLNSALFGSPFDLAFGVNSTGVVVVQKKLLDFSQAQDHTVSFGALLGLTGGITSTTNETFVTVLPGGAQINSFSPSNMLVQSSSTATLILGVFPWVGTAQRLLPDVTVTFHYPAFNSPVLSASWTTTPATFNVGQQFSLTLSLTNQGAMDAKKVRFTFSSSGAYPLDYPYGSVQYDLSSLPRGMTNTTNFRFVSTTPVAAFTISASFLDTQDFTYTWNKEFSVAANVNTNGPLLVSKSVTPASPAYGQVGNVTVTITNPSSSTYYNVVDLTPEALPFLYPNGVGSAPPSSGGGCPYINTFYANTTYFTFSVQNWCSGRAILTQILVQTGGQTVFDPVAQVNIPLSPGDQWGPLNPYPYPAGTIGYGANVVVRAVFQNSQNATYYGSAYWSGPLPQLGNPRSSYLSLDCSPCSIVKGETSTTTLSGQLVDAMGSAIPGATVQLWYRINSNPTASPLASLVTNAQGQYSFTWASAAQLPVGSYTLTADYAGSAQYDSDSEYTGAYVVEPTTVGPGGTIWLSYPYFFNATGPLTITSERIAYSSAVNAIGTNQPLVGEYVAQSSPVSLTVAPPTILPVVDISMNTTKLGFLYAAQNQDYVQVNLRVTNTGQQAASNVVVSSLIPRIFYSYYYYTGRWLPVVNSGNVTVDNSLGTVTFSVLSLPAGQEASAWYVVLVNSTNLYETSSNVTAQAPGGGQFKFSYSGPLLAGYSPLTITGPPARGFLEAFVTIDQPVIANGTSTTVRVHMYNAGNVTYRAINATVQNYYLGELSFDRQFALVPDMAPGDYQTVSFTATTSASVNFGYYSSSVNLYFSGTVYYNQSSTIRYTAYFSQNVMVYNSKLPGFNPSVSVDVSAPAQVAAGATDFVVVTVHNSGSASITSLYLNLRAFSPLFNPYGASQPETSYGAYYNSWYGTMGPGESIKFRVGILTRAGGLYPVFASYVSWNFNYNSIYGYGQIAGSTVGLTTAADTTGPMVTTPWTSPFGPTSSDPEKVWVQATDGSGLGAVNLEYSTDKQHWTTIAMTPLIGSYITDQRILSVQSIFGDIYNATIPAQSSGTTVYYRIRATDQVGNVMLQDNNGIDYLYTVQGSNSVVVNIPTTPNYQLNVSQYIPTLRASITLNVPTPIAIQVTQLPSNPAGSPPPGTAALGIYLQINANESITLDARIRIYYTSSQVQGLNASTITPYFWDGTSWVALDNVVRNTRESWVEGTIHHFSLFAVFASTPTPPPTQPPPTTSPAAQPPWLIIGVVVAVVVVAGIGGFFTARMRRRRTAGLGQTPPATELPSPETRLPESIFFSKT